MGSEPWRDAPRVIICACGCGCEPDGDWHFNEPRCACRSLDCPCVIDAPGIPACPLNERLRALCERPIHEVEVLGIHVAATGNRYGLAKEIVALLDAAASANRHETPEASS